MSFPHVEIVEQPAQKGLRFRYECEGRSAGSIPGANSTPENKTFPTIKVHGYVGPATIIATCITKDGFFVHPHNLVGRNCNQGVCSVRVRIAEDTREYQFKNLGIQCVKRRDIATALQNRQERRVDPFQMGFQHASDTSKIDLNAVRLAIQVIVKDNAGRDHSLRPVYTDIIYDKKSTSDLLIMRSSHCSGPAVGDTQIIILCEKLVQATRDDTVIAFYEMEGDEEVWCKEVTPLLVHKQVALVFNTPAYREPHTQSHVTVRFQLRRRSDQERSNSLPFEYIPTDVIRRKLPRLPQTIAIYEDNSMAETKPVVKLEPRVPSPNVGSPLHAYQPQMFSEQQRWEGGQAGPSRAGPLAYGQELPWQYAVAPQQLAPTPTPSGLPHMSPVMPHQAPLSPAEMVHMTPLGHVSPGLNHPSPMGHVSPGLGHPSPMGHASPGMEHMSPGPLPGMGHDVNMGPISPVYMQQQQQPDYQMCGVPTTVGETAAAGAAAAGGEPQTLSDFLNETGLLNLIDRENLSDSLNRLSTNDDFFNQ